ncbi:MAG: hypothetical protein ABSE46_06620 [Terracidiphilus sp.]|jgi:hypothetical protein
MMKRHLGASVSICAGLCLAFACVRCGHGQANAASPPDPSRLEKQRIVTDSLPGKPTVPPTFSIPAEPLGFSAPGSIYLGQRNALASLDFLDENRLLFTFRVPGLIRREPGESGEERQIKAVVLSLPTGNVEAEALWPVHDRTRYLWMLNDGHFLLRDRDGLQMGDAALQMKPFLHFPGPVLFLELDPQQQYLVTDSREPAASNANEVKPTMHSGDDDPTSAQPGASAAGTDAGAKKEDQQDTVLRILRRDSGKVMLVSRVPTAVRLPLNSDGYLESLRGNGVRWMLNMNFFSGGSRVVGHVDSTCMPVYEFISQRELLVTACESWGGHRLVAMDTDGHHLWDVLASGSGVWPLLVRSPDGMRVARETLAVSHAVNAYSPLDPDEIKGQLVRVFDAANGKEALAAPAIPALDAGGNVAISPSGRRVAVLNAGSIQVFELPPPAQFPDSAAALAGH